MRMFFSLRAAVLVVLATVLSYSPGAAAEIPVPDKFKFCIKKQVQDVVHTQDKATGWQQFRGYAATELMGMTAVGVRTWRGFNRYERIATLSIFFETLFKHRRVKQPRSIADLEINGRPLPDHARGELVHVNVVITYTDGDVTRLNLLGTHRCKVVDVAWGNAWLSRQISVGTIERRAYAAYQRAQQQK